MRNFNTRFRLRDSDRYIRLVYTLFLLCMLAAFVFSIFWAHSMTDLSPRHIAQHYLGSDTTYGEPMSFRELAEITHFHLFTMPVVFIILIHVLYMTEAAAWIKVATTWGAFSGVALDLISPWLIRYGSPVFALTMLAGDLLMTATFLVMLVIPLYELWIRRRPFMASGRPSDDRTPVSLLSGRPEPDPT
ncbi:MAG: hypothetical protein ACREJU_05610, partial [Nitrospiraceae bacterium]